MQQFFIDQIQFKIQPDIQCIQILQSPQFDPKFVESLTFEQVEKLIQQCCLLIMETDEKKYWIFLGMLFRQVISFIKMTNQIQQPSIRFYISTYCQLIQIMNIYITSELASFILQLFFEMYPKPDEQFWTIIAWHFRNTANNIYQFEHLKAILLKYQQKTEFLEIFIVKLRLEIEKKHQNTKIQQLLIQCIQYVLEIQPQEIIGPILIQYIQDLLFQGHEVYYIIGLIDSYIEKEHLQNNEMINYYESSICQIQNYLLQKFSCQQFNKPKDIKEGKEIIKLLTKLCQNNITIRYFPCDITLNNIFNQLIQCLINFYQSTDIHNEIKDLMSKQQSDTYICSIVRFHVALCTYVPKYMLLSFTFCNQLINTIFNYEYKVEQMNMIQNSIRFSYSVSMIQTINNIINQNQSLPIYKLSANLILFASMKPLIISQQFLLDRFEQLMRIHLINILSQAGENSISIIIMFFMQSFQKKIFKTQRDEEFSIQYLLFILRQITQQYNNTAIQIFNSITKSKSNYELLKICFPSIINQIVYTIKNTNDSDFFESITNIVKIHEDIIECYSETLLLAYQESINIQIINHNFHAVIKMLQSYKYLLRIYLKEQTLNQKIDSWEFIVQYLRDSKRFNYDEEMIDICKIYFKYTQTQDYQQYGFVLNFVIEQLILNYQQPNYLKLIACITDFASSLLYDQLIDMLMNIFQISLQAYINHYLIRKTKLILKNILTKTTICTTQTFWQIFNVCNQSNLYIILCYLCQSDCENTEIYHNQILQYALQINDVTSQNKDDIEEYCLLFIILFKYYNENYGKALRELSNQIFSKLIQLLHNDLLIYDSLNNNNDTEEIIQKKNIELPKVFEQFQSMYFELNIDLRNKLENNLNQQEKFKLKQILQARAQLGLISIIYKKFL